MFEVVNEIKKIVVYTCSLYMTDKRWMKRQISEVHEVLKERINCLIPSASSLTFHFFMLS